MTGPLIELESASFHYPEGPEVLSEISLSVHPGEFVALVGQNGAGKTTCAKLMNGILKPSRGAVRVAGEDTADVPSSTVARSVGYTYQNPDHQIWALKVEDELRFGPRNLGLPPETVEEQVEEALELADMQGQREAYTFSLGWGQRQKLAVAAVVAMRPQVIIVDEPTTGLDWEGSRRIMDLLAELNQAGLTVLIISHDMAIVTAYARRVVVFAGGRVIRDGPVAEVMYDIQSLAQADLRPPQFIRVALALADLGVRPAITPQDLTDDILTRLRADGANGDQ